jgi:AbrB family looped-hinge helix DNA binding protein
MSGTTMLPVSVRMGSQGRLVVPAPLRQALGFKPGDLLVARVEEGRLEVESRQSAVRRIQDRFGRSDMSLVDELIAERRREAREENRHSS